jgi:8-oxo-dGTP pyrophosphatase MutT (NUDIX family)
VRPPEVKDGVGGRGGGGGPRPPWPLQSREKLADFRVFRVRRDLSRNPRTGEDREFVVLEGCDWVNVVALTREGELVLVRQWRHGTGGETLEIPGGSVDPGDPSPLAAAKRELREESGYASDDWTGLGWVHPNPAIQENRCHSFLARGCVKEGEPQPDGGEDLSVELLDASAADELVRSGAITHALTLVAFHLWRLSGRGAEPLTAL